MIEFEIKARVPVEKLAALRRTLGTPERVEDHCDTYYAHPARDFAATDEALRISSRAGQRDLTYKGPKLDATTKSRVEIILPLPEGAEGALLLEALGFRVVRAVEKRRAVHHVAGFEIALDEVPGLGAFVELERQVTRDEPREPVEREARDLLASWGIHETERRSYLELLEARR